VIILMVTHTIRWWWWWWWWCCCCWSDYGNDKNKKKRFL